MTRKLIQVLFLSVFWCGLVFVGVQTWRFPTTQTTENRTLTQKPAVPESWDAVPGYVRNLEGWWTDSMAFRQLFIRHFNLLRMSVGIVPQKDVVIGKDGWFFCGGESIGDFRNNKPFTAEEVESWRQYLLFRHLDARKRGAKYIFVIIPNKETVYEEYMPDNITRLGKKSKTDQIVDSVKKDGVAVLDLRAALKEGKAKARVYHQSDTHWNLIGANYGQYEISRALAGGFPELKPVLYPVDDFEFVQGFYVNQAGIVYYGGLSHMMGIADLVDEHEPIFKRERSKCAEPADLDISPWESIPDVVKKRTFRTTKCETGHYRVVMFRDSFTELLEPYFSEIFRYIAYLWLPRPADMQAWNYFVGQVKPDIVIDETVESFLRAVPREGIDYPERVSAVEESSSGLSWADLSEKQRSVLSIGESIWRNIPAEKRAAFMKVAENWEHTDPETQKKTMDELRAFTVPR